VFRAVATVEGQCSMLEEWRSFTKYQKIIISIYLVLSLPWIPFLIMVIPFTHWLTSSANIPYKKITLMEFACFSVAMSLLGYLIIAAILWLPK